MNKGKGAENGARLVDAIVAGIQDVKGKDIVHLDLRAVPNTVCDHFVICHGDSDTQVEAIANSVEKTTRERVGEKPWHVEGRQRAEWVLLDYVNVVVHIFYRDRRSHYAIEELWGDAISQRFDNVA